MPQSMMSVKENISGETEGYTLFLKHKRSNTAGTRPEKIIVCDKKCKNILTIYRYFARMARFRSTPNRHPKAHTHSSHACIASIPEPSQCLAARATISSSHSPISAWRKASCATHASAYEANRSRSAAEAAAAGAPTRARSNEATAPR
jgi:hypothetical protein